MGCPAKGRAGPRGCMAMRDWAHLGVQSSTGLSPGSPFLQGSIVHGTPPARRVGCRNSTREGAFWHNIAF
eukprot:1154711-Pelagomonas_calceolata.AAC.2